MGRIYLATVLLLVLLCAVPAVAAAPSVSFVSVAPELTADSLAHAGALKQLVVQARLRQISGYVETLEGFVAPAASL